MAAIASREETSLAAQDTARPLAEQVPVPAKYLADLPVDLCPHVIHPSLI